MFDLNGYLENADGISTMGVAMDVGFLECPIGCKILLQKLFAHDNSHSYLFGDLYSDAFDWIRIPMVARALRL